MSSNIAQIITRELGIIDYQTSYQAMHEFTAQRDENTPDEIWILEHPPIFTQGRAGKEEHILRHSHIPVFHSDRGGQVTYHAPGQLIVYPLINLKRRGLNIREFVTLLEETVINTLKALDIKAYARPDAPGVYVAQFETATEEKICSLGLKVSKGCTLHGLALNLDIDLQPFSDINPCGLLGMQMTSIAKIQKTATDQKKVTALLIEQLYALIESKSRRK